MAVSTSSSVSRAACFGFADFHALGVGGNTGFLIPLVCEKGVLLC